MDNGGCFGGSGCEIGANAKDICAGPVLWKPIVQSVENVSFVVVGGPVGMVWSEQRCKSVVKPFSLVVLGKAV